MDRMACPFRSQFFPTRSGRLHYVDEGVGPPVAPIHGNPTSGFSFRRLILGLRDRYRCLAPDLLGFGRSDKPPDGLYAPPDHANRIGRWLDHVPERPVALLVQDWGGPIGLDWATRRPEWVRALVILNSWAWSVRGDPHFEAFSRIIGGPLGRLLIRRFNVFVRVLMPVMSFGRISPVARRHYENALGSPEKRSACAQLPGAVIGVSDWLEGIESRLSRLKDKPVLILWGMRDIAFRRKELRRWIDHFPNARVIRFRRSGHFVQEEEPAAVLREVRGFLEEISDFSGGSAKHSGSCDSRLELHPDQIRIR